MLDLLHEALTGRSSRDALGGRRRLIRLAWADTRRGLARKWRRMAARIDRWLEP